MARRMPELFRATAWVRTVRRSSAPILSRSKISRVASRSVPSPRWRMNGRQAASAARGGKRAQKKKKGRGGQNHKKTKKKKKQKKTGCSRGLGKKTGVTPQKKFFIPPQNRGGFFKTGRGSTIRNWGGRSINVTRPGAGVRIGAAAHSGIQIELQVIVSVD